MNVVKAFLFIGLLAKCSYCYPQGTTMTEVEQIKELGRDSIIQMAVKLLDREVDINNLMVRIYAGKTDINVRLITPIRYVPLNSRACYEAGVMIRQQLVSYNVFANPENYDAGNEVVAFYTPTEEDRKNLQFIVEAIKKNKGLDINIINDESITIFENRDHYQVSLISTHQESYYKVRKVSGEIYDEEHATLVPPPQEEGGEYEKFEEINFDTDDIYFAPVDIEEIIKAKTTTKKQQAILSSFRDDYTDKHKISVEEFSNHYIIIVSHPSSDQYSGGAECYQVSKETGASEMLWHESPMPLQNRRN